jgi:hypothetical protein
MPQILDHDARITASTKKFNKAVGLWLPVLNLVFIVKRINCGVINTWMTVSVILKQYKVQHCNVNWIDQLVDYYLIHTL